VIPAPFLYRRAESVGHAVELLGNDPDARILAGGHSLLLAMKLRQIRPGLLVDIDRLGELSYVRDEGAHVAIGALTRHHDVANSPLLEAHCPIVAEAAGQIGDPQVRHRGTIGGAVANGDPASDLPAVLLALDSTFVLRGPDGVRVMPASGFFKGFLKTDAGPREVLTEVRVPRLPPSAGGCYLKFKRRSQEWAVVGVAAVVDAPDGTIDSVSIGLTNMGPTPLRASEAEGRLTGAPTTPEELAFGASAAAEGTAPPSDARASAEFRRHLATVLTARALEQALPRGETGRSEN